MGTIHKTGCVLCAQNCGLEVEVENNRIVKVKPDKSNVKSEGYSCRKGMTLFCIHGRRWIVVDLRLSETAKIANIHLPICPSAPVRTLFCSGR